MGNGDREGKEVRICIITVGNENLIPLGHFRSQHRTHTWERRRSWPICPPAPHQSEPGAASGEGTLIVSNSLALPAYCAWRQSGSNGWRKPSVKGISRPAFESEVGLCKKRSRPRRHGAGSAPGGRGGEEWAHVRAV